VALEEEKVNLIATVPSHKKLQIRTIRDIANALDAKIVYNERSAPRTLVPAMARTARED
jgi:hypothetical protein